MHLQHVYGRKPDSDSKRDKFNRKLDQLEQFALSKAESGVLVWNKAGHSWPTAELLAL